MFELVLLDVRMMNEDAEERAGLWLGGSLDSFGL